MVEPTPAFGGYDGWAALHRDAADAAERWLAAILGDRPAFAVAAASATPDQRTAGRRNVESRRIDRLRVAAVRAIHAPAPPPRQPGPIPDSSPPSTAAGHNAENRALEQLRRAAVRDLGADRRPAPDGEPLPVRNRSLPTRRRSEPPTSGDMNAVMVSIARATDPYRNEISEAPDSHRAHTTAGAPEKQ